MTGGFVTYDPSGDGDITADGNSGRSYLYDGEGRICAVSGTGGGLVGYLYDAEGTRIAKGMITLVNIMQRRPCLVTQPRTTFGLRTPMFWGQAMSS